MSAPRIVGGVEVEDDLARRRGVRLEEQIDEQPLDCRAVVAAVVADPLIARRHPRRRVLQPIERRLAGQRRAIAASCRQLPGQRRQQRIEA
jgi:hypothetical protein